MLSTTITEIRACQSFDELRRLWELNREQWSQMPVDDAKTLIRAKDAKKVALVFQAEVDHVVAWLNNFWQVHHITLKEIPVEQRQRASALERLMTNASNDGQLQRAGDCLQEWRRCWISDRCYKGGRPKWTIDVGVMSEPVKDSEIIFGEQERAAIMEFDGAVPRDEAERLSRCVWCHRREPSRWVSVASCEWHKQENDPACQGCEPERLRWKEALNDVDNGAN